MRVIRFIFWFSMSVIMAYFMTDIKIGGKTIKEIIDGYLSTRSGIELKMNTKNLIEKGTKNVINKFLTNEVPEMTENKSITEQNKEKQLDTNREMIPVKSENADSDDLRTEDSLEIQKIIKNHN